MKTKHDLTARLPFPTARGPELPEPARCRRRASPLRLHQLDLRALRRSGSANSLFEHACGHEVAAAAAVCGGMPGGVLRAVPTLPERRSARAVRQREAYAFYLDLVGAVTIMALVVLAAILI